MKSCSDQKWREEELDWLNNDARRGCLPAALDALGWALPIVTLLYLVAQGIRLWL